MRKLIFLIILTLAIISFSAFYALPTKAVLVGNTNQATLTASPQTGTYSVNDNFQTSIYVNTRGQSVVVVAAYLNYDATHFQAVSIDTTGSVFTIEAEKIIDSTNGAIKITRGIPAPGVNTANGLVAKINFKATAATSPGSDNLNFQFTAGSTIESNVILNDGLGTDYLSGVYNAKYTVSGGTDTTPPTVSITAPVSGATVSGSSVTVSASASDNVGIAGVQFKLDGNNLGSEDTSSPYSISWNTTQTSNGSHTLTATARDAAGNQTTSGGITVTVNNVAPPPSDTQAPTTPTNLVATVVSSSQVNLSWSASTDNVGVVGYRIYRNDVEIATTPLTSYSDTGLSPATTYTYAVSAYDAAGNGSYASSPRTVTTLSGPPPSTPDTTPPSAVSDLSASDITKTSVKLKWTAPGDDGSQGRAASYDLRYSIVQITDASWDSATQVTGEVSPVSAGSPQSMTVVGLSPGITYYFAIKTSDEVPNTSALSNVIWATTQGSTQTSVCTSFTYSDWSACQPDSTQSRTVVSALPQGCTGGNPVLSQSCYYAPSSNVCVNFTYSSWFACQPNGTQSRTVVSASPQGCSGGSPVLSRSCNYTQTGNVCTSFTYSDWSACQPDSTQSRTVVSALPQGCTGGNPVLSQSCSYTLPSSTTTQTQEQSLLSILKELLMPVIAFINRVLSNRLSIYVLIGLVFCGLLVSLRMLS